MGDSRAYPHGAGRDLIDSVAARLTPNEAENRFVPMVGAGTAPVRVLGLMAVEMRSVIQNGRRSLMLLAARTEDPTVRAFFTRSVERREQALDAVGPLAAAAGLDQHAIDDHEPVFGCQAAPSFVAWLALNSEPAAAVAVLGANMGAWARYCTALAAAARTRYGFSDEACALLDYFSTPSRLDSAAAAVDAGIATGTVDPELTLRHARLLRGFDLMFWNTLADLC